MTLSNNSDETVKKLQEEIIAKEKIIKRQDRDIKKEAYERYTLGDQYQKYLQYDIEK